MRPGVLRLTDMVSDPQPQLAPCGKTAAATPEAVRTVVEELLSQARNPWARFNLEAAAQTLRALDADALPDCPGCSHAVGPAEKFRLAREALRQGAANESDSDNIQIALCMACLATAERYWS